MRNAKATDKPMRLYDERGLYLQISPSGGRWWRFKSAIGSAANSFEAVAREWHSVVHVAKVSTGHASRTLVRLEQDVFPWLGSLPIGEIKPAQLLQALRRVEARAAIETAHRALQACGQVFRYAIATGRAERDPTPDLPGALKPVLAQHMAAITDPKRVGELLRAIADYKACRSLGRRCSSRRWFLCGLANCARPSGTSSICRRRNGGFRRCG